MPKCCLSLCCLPQHCKPQYRLLQSPMPGRCLSKRPARAPDVLGAHRCASNRDALSYLVDSEDGSGSTRFYAGNDPATAATAQPTWGEGALSASRTASDASGVDEGSEPRNPTCGAGQPKALADGVVVLDVVPWAGRVVVFPHGVLHESLPVRRGRKSVVRADVLYWPPTR